MALLRIFGAVVLAAFAVKLLCFQLYFSTDFEVHRNWMAITHSRSVSEWYTEVTSQWTLDYPPFFAWFEFVLSHPAAMIDAHMVEVSAEPYASDGTVLFQRSSVIISEVSLITAVFFFVRYNKGREGSDSSSQLAAQSGVFVATLLNFGLLLVDNIHFQYNGFLIGIEVWVIFLLQKNWMRCGLACFVGLVYLKHLFVVLSPAVGMYILFVDCWPSWSDMRPFRVVSHTTIVLLVSAAALLPFHITDQLPVMLHRLFPFERGLLHSYWAPNFWALYTVVDILISRLMAVIGYQPPPASFTRGVIGSDLSHAFLPAVSARACLVVTLIAMLPALYHVAKDPSSKTLPLVLVLCACSSFLFGYHVHEKALLTVVVPLGLLIGDSRYICKLHVLLTAVTTISLWPLLPDSLTALRILFCITSFSLQYCLSCWIWKRSLLNFADVLLLILLFSGGLLFPHLPLSIFQRYPFLRLLTTSVVSAVGVLYVYVGCYQALFCASVRDSVNDSDTVKEQ